MAAREGLDIPQRNKQGHQLIPLANMKAEGARLQPYHCGPSLWRHCSSQRRTSAVASIWSAGM